ncbi:MAG: phage holin family protein [Myxococcota bacterium]|nr:phage holin family protein [Myxococcota bacterium]
MSILITWAVLAFSMFVASQMLSRMKIEGGIVGHFVVSAGFGLLMLLTGWFFHMALGFLSGGLLFVFGFLGKVLAGAIVLKLTDVFSDRLKVEGLGTAVLASLIISLSGTVAEWVLSATL